MAYDDELAERIRDLLLGEPDLTEQKMFGGLAFLLGGNMAVCASRDGGILVRVDPAEREHLLASTAAFPAVMGGRTMRGFLRVDAADLHTEQEIGTWVGRGAARARRLPVKQPVAAFAAEWFASRMDHVYRVTEIVGSSSSSLDEAIRNGVGRATQTLRNVDWFEVTEIRGAVQEGEVSYFQVGMKVGFRLEDA